MNKVNNAYAIAITIENMYDRTRTIADISRELNIPQKDVRRTTDLFNYQYGIKRTDENKIRPIHPFTTIHSFSYLAKYVSL